MKKERIPIDKCDGSMVLSEDLYNDVGLLLLTKGTRLTQDKVSVLVRRGVTCVPVEVEQLQSMQIGAQ
ncbi:hypothetical protein [Anoxynatronum buryatiense]|nr:hypothetical protein [Anoxynatronum buryatiense]